jgi:DNA-binding transcriptional regulator YhcF (GntR family)
MGEHLGPQSQRVYRALHDRILSGQLAPGEQLPPQAKLAEEFGVALMTIRQVLNHLQDEGLIYARHGLGTFIKERSIPAILIVDDDAQIHKVLSIHVRNAGYRSITALGPQEGLEALKNDMDIVLVFSDVRMPAKEDGIEFIKLVHRRWPETPLVALTGHVDDLAELHNMPEFPLLVLPKPAMADQIQRALHLAVRLAERTSDNSMSLSSSNPQLVVR